LGRRNKLDVHLRRSYQPEQDVDPATELFYNTFLPILNDDIWHTGTWTQENVFGTSDCWRLMAWSWKHDSRTALVIINYSDTEATGQIKVSLPDGTY